MPIAGKKRRKLAVGYMAASLYETMTSVNASRSKGPSLENQASDRLDRSLSQRGFDSRVEEEVALPSYD